MRAGPQSSRFFAVIIGSRLFVSLETSKHTAYAGKLQGRFPFRATARRNLQNCRPLGRLRRWEPQHYRVRRNSQRDLSCGDIWSQHVRVLVPQKGLYPDVVVWGTIIGHPPWRVSDGFLEVGLTSARQAPAHAGCSRATVRSLQRARFDRVWRNHRSCGSPGQVARFRSLFPSAGNRAGPEINTPTSRRSPAGVAGPRGSLGVVFQTQRTVPRNQPKFPGVCPRGK